MHIRAYQERDRQAVRQICCDTADRGEPVERLFPDRELFADLQTRYFTDFEPQSTFVAEEDGRVVGYVMGTLDNRLLQRRLAWPILPRAIVVALCRGSLFQMALWRVLGANVRCWSRPHAAVPHERFPAQLHVNLRAEGRGRHAGTALVDRFCDRARQHRRNGVYAGVREDNAAARRFFERLGFVAQMRHPLMQVPHGRLLYRVIYGKTL